MTRVAVIGECMIELSHLDDATLALAYAGDTLNMALHLARWGREAGIEVDYVTRLGDDHHSDAMVAGWEREGIGTGLVDRIAGCAPGLYLIRVDAAGERTFTYWRSASPARRLLADDAHAGVLQAGLEDADWVYLSGITLSLLGGDAHGRLLALLDALRLRGTRVAFDTNFRPAAWDSPGPRAPAARICSHGPTSRCRPSSTRRRCSATATSPPVSSASRPPAWARPR